MMSKKTWNEIIEPILMSITIMVLLSLGTWWIRKNPVRNALLSICVFLGITIIYNWHLTRQNTIIEQKASGVDDDGYREVWQKRKVKME